MLNNLCKSTVIVKELDGHRIEFHSIPLGTFMRLKNVAKKASPFLASLMVDKSRDNGKEETVVPSDVKDKDGNHYFNTQSFQHEMSTSMASLRHKQASEGVSAIIDTLFSEEAKELVEEILIKAVPGAFNESDKGKIVDTVPPEKILFLLTGVFEASKEGLGALGKSLFPNLNLAGKLKEAVEKKSQEVPTA